MSDTPATIADLGGILAQIDPSIVVDIGGPVRAIASFLAVLLVGGLIQAQFDGLLDRAVDDVVDRPWVAIVYGLFAYGLVLFGGLYISDILLRVGATGTSFGYAVLVFLTVGILVISGVGFLVVGTIVEEFRSSRQGWLGLFLGAAISTVPWLVLPFTASLAVWIALAAFGVGGRTRTWVHATRSIESG
jgi:hypothetical protein